MLKYIKDFVLNLLSGYAMGAALALVASLIACVLLEATLGQTFVALALNFGFGVGIALDAFGDDSLVGVKYPDQSIWATMFVVLAGTLVMFGVLTAIIGLLNLLIGLGGTSFIPLTKMALMKIAAVSLGYMLIKVKTILK